MKKTIVILMVIVTVFTVGSAFAADKTLGSEAGGMTYNGITIFDLGPAAVCADSSPSDKESVKKSFNGITYFDLGQAGSGAKGSCAGGSQAVRSAAVPFYNGITVF
jgi:hypothetical protein